MSKFLTSVIVLIVLGMTLSGNPEKCTSETVLTPLYECQDGNTCCPDSTSVSGWRCYDIVDGVCCKGDLTVCPSYSQCDNTNNVCKLPSTSLRFLDSTTPLGIENSYEPFRIRNLGETLITKELIKGYIDGIGLFTGVSCDIDDGQLKTALGKIIDIVREFKSYRDISSSAKRLLEQFKVVKNRLVEIIPSCVKSKDQYQKSIDALNKLFTSLTYQAKLVGHLLSSAFEITGKCMDFKNKFNERNDYDNGKAAGEIIRFVLFWDLDL